MQVKFGVDRLICRNTPMNALLSLAFEVTRDQLSSHPALDDRWDIEAKAAGPATRAQLRQMLGNLLMDRFKLALHHDAKDMQAFTLVIGKDGHKLREAEGGPDSGWEMLAVVRQLWFVLKAPVIDMTALNGRYSNKLNWGAMQDPEDPEGASRVELGHLGLALVRQRAKVDFLVIDHLEAKPTEN
jgi:hypothetical protein